MEAFGRNPDRALGDSFALGSSCSPGTEQLPDGVWFGWVVRADTTDIEFDLACLWPGRIELAASNDANRIRTIPTTADSLVYIGEWVPVSYPEWIRQGTPTITQIANAPGLPDSVPFWMFVNDGVMTEMAQYPTPIVWAQPASGWPGLFPGCCDGGTTAPPSPADPWPERGWPADGFYSAFVNEETETHFELTLRKWLSCRDYPELCPEWWVEDDVTSDPDQPTLQRSLVFDEDLTVVIMPIFGESPIVGDGVAFRNLLADLNKAVDVWILEEPDTHHWDEFEARTSDPAFPFGHAAWSGTDDSILGYRGPGGSHLTWYGWWVVLEIRNGLPVLYAHAGLIAG